MNLRSLFTEHPASVGESYFEHLANATRFAARMLLGAVACFIHAVFPFLFVKTGSHAIQELNERMILHRSKMPISGAPSLYR